MRVDTLFAPETEKHLAEQFVLVVHNQLPELYVCDQPVDGANAHYSKEHMAIVKEGADDDRADPVENSRVRRHDGDRISAAVDPRPVVVGVVVEGDREPRLRRQRRQKALGLPVRAEQGEPWRERRHDFPAFPDNPGDARRKIFIAADFRRRLGGGGDGLASE